MATWLGRRFRPRSDDPAALEAFLGRQAAFVSQKTVLDYCRVKAGRDEPRLFADPDFKRALDHCRWQTFAGSVADLCAMAEAWLRPHAADATALADSLAALGGRLMAAAAVPEAERASLDAAAQAIGPHLARLQLAAPRPANRLSLLAQAPLLATLPIHPEQRIGEAPAITGALRFHMVAAQQEMEREFDAPRLAARLAGG